MNKLKEIREKKNYTPKEAARILQVRLDSYLQMEAGAFDDNDDLKGLIPDLEEKLKKNKPPKLPTFSQPIFLSPAIGKGGTGKTSSVISLAGALSENFQVLIVDCTEQVDATMAFLSNEELRGAETIYDAMDKVDDIRNYIMHTANPMIDIVPSDYRLDDVESFLARKLNKDQVLRACFRPLVEENMYDFVLIDVSNHLGSFADVIWMASQTMYLYMIIRPKTFDLSQFARTKERIDEKSSEMSIYGNRLINIGIFLNEVNMQAASADATIEALKNLVGDLYIDEYIRRDENINHSQTYKRPITKYKPSSRASKDYFKLADEIVRRIERYENGKEK